MALTIEQFAPFCIERERERVFPVLLDAMTRWKIDEPLEVAAFLATVAHESARFYYWQEIASGWAYDITRNPKKALRLGNRWPGDGPKFKGHGPIQVTGRDNHRAATKAFGEGMGVDFEKDPQLLTTPKYGIEAACWFWASHGLNELAQAGKFFETQQRVNGTKGEVPPNHWAERQALYVRAVKAVR